MKKIAKPEFPDIIYRGYICYLDMVSRFPGIKASFNFVNKDFPYLHKHTHWEIILVTQGSCTHTLNNIPRIMSRGDAVIVRPNEEHKIENLPISNPDERQSSQHIAIHFSDEVAVNILSIYNHSDFFEENSSLYLQLSENRLNNRINKLIYIQLLSRLEYETNTLIIVNKFFMEYIEQKMNTSSFHYPDWLNVFLQKINNPSCFNKSIDVLAADTPYSYSRLSVLFKEYTNTPLSQYITEIKMKYATKLLKRTNMNILHISTYLGYDSIASFNRNFKKYFNTTPSDYRKENQIINSKNEPPSPIETL